MISLFKPYVNPDLPLLDKIVHSGQLAYGTYAHQFENALASYLGLDQLIFTSSFNTAYLIALKTLNLGVGDEVIASPMCCLASSQPFAISGIKLIWADVNPKEGVLDFESVVSKITSKTKAILHNHFGGYVGHVKEIVDIAKTHGLLVIDDVSEAFGATYNNRPVGQWGADATIYSFQTVRIPNSIDGGGISFSDSSLYEKAIRLRDYGIDRTCFRDDIGEISPLCDITEASYGALPNDVNGYVGLSAIPQINRLIAVQRKNANYWNLNIPQGCESLNLVEETCPNYWVYGVLAENKREFIQQMRSKGYFASGVHLPNNLYSLFGKQGELPGVNEFASKFVALPCGWWMNND